MDSNTCVSYEGKKKEWNLQKIIHNVYQFNFYKFADLI